MVEPTMPSGRDGRASWNYTGPTRRRRSMTRMVAVARSSIRRQERPMPTHSSHAIAVLAGLVLAAPVLAQAPDQALVARARAIHDRVITLDTHDDIDPRDFTKARNYTQRLDNQVN